MPEFSTADEYFAQKSDAQRILTLEITREGGDYSTNYLSDDNYQTEENDDPSGVVFSPVIGDGGLPSMSREIADPFSGVGSTSFGSVSLTEELMAWFYDHGLFDLDGEETPLLLEDGSATLTRASAGSYYGVNNAVVVAPINGARFNRNLTTLAVQGLLIEAQRTNLCTHSEAFGNAAWTKQRCGVTSDAIVAPDGTLSADKMTEQTDVTTNRSMSDNIAVTSGVKYVFSVFAFAAERTSFNLRLTPQFAAGNTTFNLLTKVASQSGTVNGSGIEDLGNGWFRCWQTQTANATGNTNAQIFLSNPGISYSGVAGEGMYFWGAQLEVSPLGLNTPTSYIPSLGSSATRAADSLTAPAALPAVGEFYVDAIAPGLQETTNDGFKLSDGTVNNMIIFRRTSGGFAQCEVIVGGVQQALLTSAVAWTTGTRGVLKLQYSVDSFSFLFNNNVAGSDVLGTLPPVTTFSITGWNSTAVRAYLKDLSDSSLEFDFDFTQQSISYQRVLHLGFGSGIETFAAKRGARIVGKMAAPRRLFPYSSARTLFTGQLARKSGDCTGKLTLEIRDRSETIKKAVIPVGDDPICLGRVRNAECRLRDPLNLKYSVHDGAIRAILNVYDQGELLNPALYTVDPSATPQLTLAGTPAGIVTADVEGHVDEDGNWLSTTQEIASELLRRCSIDIEEDYGSIDGGIIGIYIEQSANLGQWLTDIFRGAASYWLIDNLGVFFADSFPVPADGGTTVYGEKVNLEEPKYREEDRLHETIRFGYRRNWSKFQSRIGATADQALFTQSDGLESSVTMGDPDEETQYLESEKLETFFDSEGAAQNAAQRILTLYSIPRIHINTSLAYSEDRQLGDGITIYFNGRGHNAVILRINDVFDGSYPVQEIGVIA